MNKRVIIDGTEYEIRPEGNDLILDNVPQDVMRVIPDGYKSLKDEVTDYHERQGNCVTQSILGDLIDQEIISFVRFHFYKSVIVNP